MKPLDLVTLVALAGVWGSSYLFIRIAVPDFGPTALAGTRVALSALLLWAVAAALRWWGGARCHLRRALGWPSPACWPLRPPTLPPASYTRVRLRGVPVHVLALGQQVGALVWLVLPSLILAPRVAPRPAAWASLIALGVVCTAVAYLLYFRLIERVGPTNTATVTYLIPVLGVAWGALFLAEPISAGMVAGLLLIMLSMVLVNEIRLPGLLSPMTRGRAAWSQPPRT